MTRVRVPVRHFRPASLLVGAAFAAALLAATDSSRSESATPSNAPGDGDVFLPPSDRDAESWLKRAEDAARQEDWKLAIDTLTRMMDQYGDRTVTPDDGQHYYSAMECAQRQIANWPPDGLAAYRTLFDAEAGRLLEKAKAEFNLDALRLVVRRYPHTTQGPQAVDLLSTWLIDRRQAVEAIDLLTRIATMPRPGLPEWKLRFKLAAALALAGERERAGGVLHGLENVRASTSSPVSGERPPDDWPQRVARLRRFVEEHRPGSGGHLSRAADPTAADTRAHRWPSRFGPPGALGRMPPIEPAVTPDEIWHEPLPGAGRRDVRTELNIIRGTGRPPVWQAVSDGKAIFVTCPDGLIARDLATFDLLWQAVPKLRPRDRGVERQRMLTLGGAVDNTDRLDELSTRTLFHEYRGAVSTAYGLVFCIEQPTVVGEEYPTRQGVVPPNDIFTAEYTAEPNSLRAYDARTGRALWTKGRGGPVNDELKAAHFFATPVACETGGGAGRAPVPRLIAPYQSGRDLFLAVLSPDGSILKTVLLGTAEAGAFPMNGLLEPAVSDGVVFLQTGAGALVALDAADFSLRWISAYERAPAVRRGTMRARGPWGGAGACLPQPDEWLSSPPMVIGSTVLLAAHDSENLLAFDRHTGVRKWAYPRGTHRYIVGADERTIVIAGQQVLALDVATGRALWSCGRATLTGRPALCGDVVLTPTEDGLLRLDLLSGEPVGERLASGGPLGNLLAFDGALFSIGAQGVTKFPDVERSRTIAEELLRKDPADLHGILRLASVAMLKKDWTAALAILDRAPTAASPARAHRRPDEPGLPDETPHAAADAVLLDRLAHQRVVVLLQLAAEAGPDRRLALSRQAAQAARRTADLVRARLALCEALTENGRHEESFREGCELLARCGDVAVPLENDLEGLAQIPIREMLQRIWNALDDGRRRRLSAELLDESRRALAAHDWRRLTHWADALAQLSAAAWLDLELGKAYLSTGAPESAVFFLERAARRALAPAAAQTAGHAPQETGHPLDAIAVEALCRLAVEYARPNPAAPEATLPRAPYDAVRVLRLLEERYADADLPPLDTARATLDPGAPAQSGHSAVAPSLKTVGALVAQLRSVLPAGCLADDGRPPDVLSGTPRLALRRTELSSEVDEAVTFWDPSRRDELYDDVLPLGIRRQITGLRLGTGEAPDLYWATDIEPSPELESPALRPGRSDPAGPRSAAIAGRVALLGVGPQFVAVGLTSGRLMWPPLSVDIRPDAMPDRPAVAADGVLVVAVGRNTLIGVPAREDARVLWRRYLDASGLRTLAVVDGSVVTMDRSGSSMWVIDPWSGRIRRRASLLVERSAGEAPAADPADETAGDAVMVGSVLCRSEPRRLVAHDALTGRRLWETEFDDEISRLIALDDRHVGVCLADQALVVVGGERGDVLRKISSKLLVFPPIDATLDWPVRRNRRFGGRVLLHTTTHQEPAEFVLASFALDKSEKNWIRELGPSAMVSRRMLRASSDWVAAVSYSAAPSRKRMIFQINVERSTARLVVFDKVTNERLLDRPYTFDDDPDLPRRDPLLFSDVIVRDRMVIALGPEGYHVLVRSTDETLEDDPEPENENDEAR